MNCFKALSVMAVIFGVGAFASPASAQTNEYVFILGARGNPYWTALADGIKDAAKSKEDVVVFQTESDSDAEGQLNICQTAIQRKPKVLAMQAINSGIGLECFKQASAAGIIVADIDHHMTLAEAKVGGVNLAYTVGSDNVAIGNQAAEFVAKSVGKSNPKILVLEGAPGSVPGTNRVNGFVETIKRLLPSAQVTSISAEWDRLKAMTITGDTLQREPDLDIVFAANDVMALGAVEGVHNAGKQGAVKVIGIDGTADARKAVEAGTLTATVAQLPYLIGTKATELSIAAANGAKMGQNEMTPTVVLTSDVLKQNTDLLLQYVR